MRGETHTVSAHVSIRAPYNARDKQPPELGDDILGKYLRSVTVTNGIDEPFGRFSIECSPEVVAGAGAPLAKLIQPYSLVSIAFHRGGHGRAATANPVPLMLGVVDEPEESEDFQGEEPRRQNQLTGRSLAGLLSDHRWWFHHYLAFAGEVQLPPDVREFFAVRPDDRALRDESSLRALGFLAIDPGLFEVANRQPVALMEAAWRFFVSGTADRGPFIKNRWETGKGSVPIDQLLRFDAEAARSSYFDPSARMVSQYLPTDLPNASCWDLLHYFSEPYFTELFTDTAGDSLGGAYVEVKSRKPPFAGHVVYPDGRPRISYSTGPQRPRDGQSLFDSTFGAWDINAETEDIDGSDVLGMPQLSRGVGEGTFNLYDVQPAVFANAGGRTGDRLFQQEIPPIIDEILDSPSYVERLGIRPLRTTVRSIAVLDAATNEAPAADLREQCLVYAALLREWNFRQPNLYRGSYVLKGRTSLRPGKRLVDHRADRSEWEFYIRRVAHRITLEEQPFYSTTVQVDRGWPLFSRPL